MSSLVTSLIIIQQNTIRYGFPLLLGFGNIGNLFLIIIFSQSHHRRNPCSLYLLTSTIFGLIGMNWGFGTNLNAIYQIPDPFTISLVLCRTRGYILQITSVIYRTMIVLACIDRFAISSSQPNIRRFSKCKIALKMIIGSILFWLTATIHLPIFQTIQNNRCAIFGTYGLFFSIYQICIFGFIFPSLMIVFGILLWKNLKNVRIRVHPLRRIDNSQQNNLHKRDIQLMKFVLVEIVVAVFLTFLYPINTLYGVLVSNISNKSQERIQIEIFINFIIMLVLFYLNFCINFYLFIIMSKSFRREIKHMLIKYVKKPSHTQTNTIPLAVPMQTETQTKTNPTTIPLQNLQNYL